MAFGFTQESRGTVRRRVGRLLYPEFMDHFTGTLTAAVSTTVMQMDQVKLIPDDSLVGKTAYCPLGVNGGASRLIVSNTQSSGQFTVSPAWTSFPPLGDFVEVWPELTVADAVNEHIDMAIQRISETVGIYIETLATLDSDLRVVPLPATLNKFIGVRYVDQYHEKVYDYMATADPWQDPLGGHSATIRGSSIYLNQPVPSASDLTYVRGYRAPAIPSTDNAMLEVNPAYLAFMAAYMLDAGRAYSAAIDPEQHAARATNWFNQAKDIELRSQTTWLPHTIPVDI